MRLSLRVAFILLWIGTGAVWADTIHVVKAGETLARICEKYDAELLVVQRANNLKPGAALRPGMRIFIPGEPIPAPPPGQPDPPKSPKNPVPSSPGKVIVPPPSGGVPNEYTVKTGDTLFSLSRRFASTPDKIRALNNMTSDDLKVGQRIKLRDGESAPPLSTEVPPGRNLPTEREVATIKSRLAESTPQSETSAKPAASSEERPSPAGPVSIPVPPPERVPGGAKPSDSVAATRQNPREEDDEAGRETRPQEPRRVPSPLVRIPPPQAPPPANDDREVSRPSSTKYIFVKRVKEQIDNVPFRASRWKYVVLHHSGTNNGNAKIFDYYHRHERGMPNGLAYHFVIGNGRDSGDGEIEVGPRWTKQMQGGHVHSDALNEISIGICFVGDYNKYRPTKKQIAAAVELIAYLNDKCDRELVLKAHREINPRPTDCPGKYFPIRAFHQLFN